MDPTALDDDQSEAERLEISRRYRELHTNELRDSVAGVVDGEVEAVGEFATLPFASYAAIPLFGAAFAIFARWRASARSKLPERMLLALDEATLYAINRRVGSETASSPGSTVDRSWPRDSVRVTSVEDRFLSTEVIFETGDDRPLKLYAPRLKNNPWSSQLVRLLGGEAPAARDLS